MPISPEEVIFRESVVNGDTLDIPLWYPRNSEIKKLEISLMDVRAADSITIEYDFVRDGWVIKQASKFEWEEDETCDPDWQEVAFVQAWAREQKPVHANKTMHKSAPVGRSFQQSTSG